MIQPDGQTVILLAEKHREGLLSPLIGSAVDVEGGGVEQNDQARDETCCEWMTFKARRCATRPNHISSLTHVRVKGQRSKVRSSARH